MSGMPHRLEFAIVASLLLSMCPHAAASPVIANVSSNWSYDSTTKQYTYSYVLRNAANSPNHIECFGLSPVAKPIKIVAPPAWMALRGWSRDSSSVVWAVLDPGPTPPNWDGQLLLGPHHLAPGASVGGFQIISDEPPDTFAVQFWAQGFDTIPGGAHGNPPRPPGLKTLWEEGWIGPAIGPKESVAAPVLDVATPGVSLKSDEKLSVMVEGSAVFDSTSSNYTYSYSVKSDSSSSNDLDGFRIGPVFDPVSISAPTHWRAFRYQFTGQDSGIVWRVVDVGKLPRGHVDTGNVPPSEFDLRPGATQAGFSFVSPIPPSPTSLTFVAQGFDTIGSADHGDEDPQPTFFERGTIGKTIGQRFHQGVRLGGSPELGLNINPSRFTQPRGSTTATYLLERPARVELAVHDAEGRRVRKLSAGRRPAGVYSCSWNGTDDHGEKVRAGAYFFLLIVDGKRTAAQGMVQVR